MSRRRKRIEKLLQRPARMRFDEVEQVLRDFGWTARRTKGSHVWFAKPGGPPIPIPKAGGQWVEHVYLDKLCRLLELDTLDLDHLDHLDDLLDGGREE